MSGSLHLNSPRKLQHAKPLPREIKTSPHYAAQGGRYSSADKISETLKPKNGPLSGSQLSDPWPSTTERATPEAPRGDRISPTNEILSQRSYTNQDVSSVTSPGALHYTENQLPRNKSPGKSETIRIETDDATLLPLEAPREYPPNAMIGTFKSPTLTNAHRKSTPHSTERRRSRSIGALSRESRIAALSTQLRSRLSYAAAKIEKKRQSHLAQLPPSIGLLASRPSVDSLSQVPSHEDIERHRLMENISPNGTTISAPDPTTGSRYHSLDGLMRHSPGARSDDLSQHPRSNRPAKSLPSSASEALSLAPPPDVASSCNGGARRRPNPNEPHYAPFSRHRRHLSQQDLEILKPATISETILVPETPALRPTRLASSGLSDHSQNLSMEQDAIETLLFMSSPGNSGYQPNSKQLHNPIRSGSNTSQEANVPAYAPDGPIIPAPLSQNTGLEAQAGDEIDRMLDQMDSDSDDDKYSKAS